MTHFILNILAVLLVDYLTVSDQVGGTPRLLHGLAHVLVLRAALGVKLRGALLLMTGFLVVLGKIYTLELGSVIALLIIDLAALFVYVLDSLTFLLVVN